MLLNQDKSSKDLLKDGYDILDKFYEDDMTPKITRSFSLENYIMIQNN